MYLPRVMVRFITSGMFGLINVAYLPSHWQVVWMMVCMPIQLHLLYGLVIFILSVNLTDT